MTKVIISGEGGQGVRVIGHTLATLLVNLDYEVSLLYDYDSSVRGAMSVAYLVFDDKPIDNPMVDDADILLKLSDKADGFSAEKTVCQTGLCTDEQIPFEQMGEGKSKEQKSKKERRFSQEQYDFLKQCSEKGDAGIKEWNAWRKKHPVPISPEEIAEEYRQRKQEAEKE